MGVGQGEGPCMVSSNVSCVLRTLPLNRMTDTTENITFPQFLWQAVKKKECPGKKRGNFTVYGVLVDTSKTKEIKCPLSRKTDFDWITEM